MANQEDLRISGEQMKIWTRDRHQYIRNLRKTSGLTLLELVVAISVWMVLLVGATQILVHITAVSTDLISQQEAHENARVAADALVVNLQMAEEIELRTDADGMLRRLTVYQINPGGTRHPFVFTFDRHAPPTASRFERLQFGGNNELASNLSEVRLILSPCEEMIHISITSSEILGEPITVTSTVDIRYKDLTVR